MSNINLTADFVVVGGGLAGCVLASRLSQSPSKPSVILIEAGSDEHEIDLIKSPSAAPRLHRTELEWNYMTVPQQHLNGRQVYNCGGKVLSGSSAVNYGLWTRGSRPDYDIWADLIGDKRWSYDGLLPYFRRSEHYHDSQADPSQHGFKGPIHTMTGRAYPLRQQVHQAFLDTGLKDNSDSNAGDPLGVASWCENWHHGVRQPAGQAYDLSNVHILTSTLVHRVLFSVDHGIPHATGVDIGSDRTVTARREVIISCGAYRTPQLLLMSGIGPSTSLSKYGIPVVIDNPAVGTNFSDHISCIQFWKLRDAAQGVSAGSPQFAENPVHTGGLPFDWIATSSVPSNTLSAALKSDANDSDLSASPALPKTLLDRHTDVGRAHYELLLGYTILGRGNPAFSAPFDGTHISTAVLCLLPTSRGTITLSPSSPTDPAVDPLIDPNYYATANDRTIMHTALRHVQRLMASSAAREFVAEERPPEGWAPLSEESSDADIDERVRQFSATLYHGSGGACAGSVVDAEMRVKGTTGLRVCDASVFPAPVAAHYQAAVYAVAEMGADMVMRENVLESL